MNHASIKKKKDFTDINYVVIYNSCWKNAIICLITSIAIISILIFAFSISIILKVFYNYYNIMKSLEYFKQIIMK